MNSTASVLYGLRSQRVPIIMSCAPSLLVVGQLVFSPLVQSCLNTLVMPAINFQSHRYTPENVMRLYDDVI